MQEKSISHRPKIGGIGLLEATRSDYDIPEWRVVDHNRCQGVFEVYRIVEYVPVRPDGWRGELKFPWGPAEEYSRR